MPDTKVKLIIETATSRAMAEVKKFTDASKNGLQSVANTAKSAGVQMKAAWSAAKAAWVEALAVIYALKKAWDFAQDAAMYKERAQAFHNMAASMGVDGRQLLAELKRLSRGTISEFQLMEKAGTAMSMDIPAERLKGLMNIARATAKVTGQTVEQAFSDISLGVARQSKMILDNLGIIVQVEKANNDYAKAIGKVASELTDAEKKQAFLNATMAAGEKIIKRVGIEAETTAEKMQRWKAQWKDISIEIGKVSLTTLHVIDLIISGASTAINWAIRSVTYTLSQFFGLLAKIPKVGEFAFGSWARGLEEIDDYVRNNVEWGINHVNDTLAALKSVWADVKANADAAGKSQVNASNKAAEAAKKAKNTLKELLDKEKEAADIRRQATEEMYRESGIDAEAAARLEVQKLVEKASKWEQAGVDILKINDYLYDKLAEMYIEAYDKGETAADEYYYSMMGKADVLVQEFQATQTDVMGRLGAVDKSLDKYRSIFIEDNASENLYNIKRLLDSIHDKTVRVSVIKSSSVGNVSGGGGLSGGELSSSDIQSSIANDIKYGRSPIPAAMGG